MGQHWVGSIFRINPDNKAGGDELYAPRPGFATKPLVPGEPNTTIQMINPAISTVASSVDMAKLKVRGKELEAELEKLTRAKKVLRDAVEYCKEGKIVGFPDLESGIIEIFTDAITDQVEAIMHKVEMLCWLDEVQGLDLKKVAEIQRDDTMSSLTAQGAAGGQGGAQKEASKESRRKSQPIVGQKKKRISSMPSPTAKQRLQIKENKNSNNFVIAAKNAAKIYVKEEK